MIDFDLLSYAKNLQVTLHKGSPSIIDPTRRTHVAALPEELVRQALIQKLHHDYKIPIVLMKSECEIKINALKKRVDLVIFNRTGIPQMLIEVKAPSVKLSQLTSDQAALYNNRIFAPWMMLVNGINAMIFKLDFDDKTVEPHDHFPELKLN